MDLPNLSVSFNTIMLWVLFCFCCFGADFFSGSLNTVFQTDHDDTLDSVMEFVYSNGAGDTLKVFCRSESFLNCLGIGGICTINAIGNELAKVMTGSIKSTGISIILFFKSSLEFNYFGILVHCGIMVGEVDVIQCIGTGQFQ